MKEYNTTLEDIIAYIKSVYRFDVDIKFNELVLSYNGIYIILNINMIHDIMRYPRNICINHISKYIETEYLKTIMRI